MLVLLMVEMGELDEEQVIIIGQGVLVTLHQQVQVKVLMEEMVYRLDQVMVAVEAEAEVPLA